MKVIFVINEIGIRTYVDGLPNVYSVVLKIHLYLQKVLTYNYTFFRAKVIKKFFI